MRKIYYILWITSAAFILIAGICFAFEKSYAAKAAIVQATVIDFSREENSEDKNMYRIVVMLATNGREERLKASQPTSINAIARKQLLGKNISILYQIGQTDFKENTFGGKWFWTCVSTAFFFMSLISIAFCFAIDKLAYFIRKKVCPRGINNTRTS